MLTRFFFLCALVSGTVFAQSTLTGRVTDTKDEGGLAGATVAIEGTTLGTVTDGNGNFTLDQVPDGEVVVTVSYIGYETLRKSVNAPLDRLLNLRPRPSSVNLETVTVSGIAEGQIVAMIEMKQAENIKNIVSAEQIRTFPDLNAAEVLQRVPGITLQRDQGEGRFVQLRGTPPELTNFNINGEQVPSPEGGFRYVGLDIIPSDQIEAIEVTKVITPDMDGDGIGGSVNIRTKLPKSGRPDIRAAVAGGYNNLRATANYNAQFSYGQRVNGFGFQVNGSYFRNNQGSDNIEYKFAKGPFFNSQSQEAGRDNFNLHYREAQLRHYDITRTRASVATTLDYEFNDNSKIYLRGMINQFTDAEIRRRLIFELDDPFSFDFYLFGDVLHDVRQRTKEQNLSTIALGGEHRIGRATLDYQLFHARAGEDQPDRLEAGFESPGQAVAIDFDRSDPDYPRATFPNENNAANAVDFENFTLDEFLLETATTQERLWTPRINLTLPYRPESAGEGYVKFGGKIRFREKEADIRSQVFGAYRETSILYPGTGDPLNLVTAADDFREDDLLGEGYVLQSMPSPDIMRDFYEFFPQFFVISRNESRSNTYNQDYTYAENIYAGYAMFRHDFGRLMVLGGIRYERTEVLDNTGFGVVLNGNRFIGIDTIDERQSQAFWLPQLQFKYELTPNVNLRAAITRTYARPNYSDVIPAREVDRREISIGNPQLNYPVSTNIDLLIERYFGRSIFSGGLFYKQIDDFVFSYKRFGREGAPGSGNFPVFEFTKPLNGRDARVLGIEVQAQFKFDILPGILSDFGLYTNYTFTDSKAFIPRRMPANLADAIIIDPIADDLSAFFTEDDREEITLPGQAKHNANVGLFYDGPKFFARLTANYQDAFLLEIGADPDLDEFYDESLRLDFTTNYQIGRRITVFGDWINVTNTPLRFYLGSEEIIKQQEFYSWWSRVGVRMRF